MVAPINMWLRGSMRTKYTVEKVLYLSDQPCKLNVSITERNDTDLSARVAALLSVGCIELVAEDDSDKYYGITNKGKVKLLKLQIQWRKQHGKPTDVHELLLEELTEA